jgi:CRP-like cAMP-binding protein
VSTAPLDLLADSPFFEGFDPRDLVELSGHARMVAFQAGTRIFIEGEPATGFFLLASGAVDISFAGPAGQDTVVQTVTHAGHPVGWSAMTSLAQVDSFSELYAHQVQASRSWRLAA